MNRDQTPSPRLAVGALAAIAGIVAVSAGAFAYTAGWLSPARLTSEKIVAAFTPPGVNVLGHRRNHAKGICFTGVFDASGQGDTVSAAPMLATGQYAALGRFNLGTGDPDAADATVRVRGIGLQITGHDGSMWRMAMINAPVFPVATVEGFHDLQLASGSKEPDAMKKFAAAHPEIAGFGAWAQTAPWTGSYAEDRYNALNAFLFVDRAGVEHPVRWSLVPAAVPAPITPEELAKRGPNYLEQEITQRVAQAPQRWRLVLTLAEPGDPTNDPSKAWPDSRRTIDAGTLIVQHIEAEADGPCRDINFDPTVLPNGIRVSDDPFPPARSAAYARSYNLRTAEARDYPRTAKGAPQ